MGATAPFPCVRLTQASPKEVTTTTPTPGHWKHKSTDAT
eukprot:CAMPEP_0204327110 /NCGR_PEP_ID=MMETSP0469-20131031/12344_1 /ASSEMBLY_ACC=CAM_ASM_000384 /TAXON_ID=2969 /ORGANISM="Oxyrrhis marina" /LENGTH=38 /DNA_ID= /DNA_START= /DNA_END= /DNA_ORIENTATION=